MTCPPSRTIGAGRLPRALTLLALVAAVVVAVLVLQEAHEQPRPPAAGPATPTTPADSPTDAPSPDQFCAAFRTFADRHANHSALLDQRSGEQLVAAADALVALGRPIGLPMGGWLSLIDLVNGTIAEMQDVEPHPTPDDAGDLAPDTSQLDVYLAAACPA